MCPCVYHPLNHIIGPGLSSASGFHRLVVLNVEQVDLAQRLSQGKRPALQRPAGDHALDTFLFQRRKPPDIVECWNAPETKIETLACSVLAVGPESVLYGVRGVTSTLTAVSVSLLLAGAGPMALDQRGSLKILLPKEGDAAPSNVTPVCRSWGLVLM